MNAPVTTKRAQRDQRARPARAGIARFAQHEIEVDQTIELSPDHPAVVEGRTIFPGSVVGTAGSPRFLVSGMNNAKLGKQVMQGKREGWPIYHLTLEERATCPRSCLQWRSCYGSGMPYARRHRADAAFLPNLRAEVQVLARAHPQGLLLRLHTLGDFYSVEYVLFWGEILRDFPNVNAFGYTARRADDPDLASAQIAQALQLLTGAFWDRFAIRTSHATPGRQRAIVVLEPPTATDVILCPAQVEKTSSCGTCGLCWAEGARDKTIAFLKHGMKRRRATKAPPATDLRNPAGGKIPSSQGGARGAEAVTGDSPVASASTNAPAPVQASDKFGQLPDYSAMQTVSMARLVGTLARLAGPDGGVTISYARLSQESGIPSGSLGFLTYELEKRGLVRITKGAERSPKTYHVVGEATPVTRSPAAPPPPEPQFSPRDRLVAALPDLFRAHPGGVLVGDIMKAAGSCGYHNAMKLVWALAEEGLAHWALRPDKPCRKALFPARPPAARSPATSLQKVQIAPAEVTARQPAPQPTRPPAGRQIARGARFENLGDGVSVIRLKPISEAIVSRARQQVRPGFSVADFAEMFNVDADALDRALKAGARA